MLACVRGLHIIASVDHINAHLRECLHVLCRLVIHLCQPSHVSWELPMSPLGEVPVFLKFRYGLQYFYRKLQFYDICNLH